MEMKRKIGNGVGGTRSSVKASSSSKRTKFLASKGTDNDSVNKDETKKENQTSGIETDFTSITVGVGDPTKECGEFPPLLNKLILTNLFKYLPLDELPSHRLVCRTWRDVTLSKWRSSAVPKLRYSKLDGMITLNDGTSLADFLDFWDEHCGPKPYRNFCILGWRFGGKKNLDGNFFRFWHTVGGHLNKLKMANCRSTKSKGIFKVISEHCTNLEELILQNISFYPLKGYRRKVVKEETHTKLTSLHVSSSGWESLCSSMGISFYELLSNFPNLTYFKLGSERAGQQDDIIDFCKAVLLMRSEDPNKLPITRLGTRHPVELERVDVAESTKEMLEILKRVGISLETIFFMEDMGLNDFKEIIEAHGGSLIKMFYYMNEKSSRWSFPFGVQLERLRVLETSHDLFKNLDFMMFAPNLEKLRIIDKPEFGYDFPIFNRPTKLVSRTSQAEFDRAGVTLMQLTAFTMENYVSDDDLRFLAKCMPNLRNLRMVLNDELFPIVCEHWQGLVELEVLGDRLTDKGVTGVKFRRISMATVEVNGEAAIRPNITFLRRLEVFKGSKTMLTNMAFSRGFLNLNNLRKITLDEFTQINPRIMKRLGEQNIKFKQIKGWPMAAERGIAESEADSF